jgi:hypothetical protein
MSVNVTYLFGAGASYHALPLVSGFGDRFEMFCNHLSNYLKTKISSEDFNFISLKQKELINNIKNHYTVDTYAKKLFLKNPRLHTNQEYILLTNYLSAYFIYEQLKIDLKQDCNNYLRDIFSPTMDGNPKSLKTAIGILKDFDYRYDSFFASILNHAENNSLIIPKNINFISWNYDFQMEKAFMNFSDCSLTSAIESLNVFATPQEIFEKPVTDSHLIKLNGTAGFLRNGKFSELFDFDEHTLDSSFFEICKNILLSPRQKNENAIRFSWEKSPLLDKAINLAQQKIANSQIVVVIGYSFPYFNREIDKKLFELVQVNSNLKIYIQIPKEQSDSVIARFRGILPHWKVEAFTETDQFLIPSELT